jgi:hypothetical protein
MLTTHQIRLQTFPVGASLPRRALGFVTHDYVEHSSPGGAS